jgi:hypothetical protein
VKLNDSGSDGDNCSEISDDTCKVRLVPVAPLSKAQVFSRSPVAIVGSNTTGGLDVGLSCVLRVCCLVEVSVTSPSLVKEESY